MLITAGVGERLRKERERIGLNQTDFGARAAVSRGTQKAYEQETSTPDTRYLSALESMGIDIHYVLSGERSESSLSPPEQTLINLFRSAPGLLQAAALGTLQAGLSAGTTGGASNPPATVKIKEVSGQVNTGAVTNEATTMNFGTKGS